MLYAAIMFFLLILYFFVLVYFVYTIYAMVKAAPFVPMNKKNVQALLDMAKLKSGDILMDLGSGDGRILELSAPFVNRAIGIEINPLLYFWSRFKLRNIKNTYVRREDLWSTSLADINVLTLYFIPHKMGQLAEKIKKEMKPGSRVVSYAFQFHGWQYIEKNDKIYLYVV